MFFAIGALVLQGIQQEQSQSRMQIDEEFRQQMLSISAEQERVNAEAQAAARMAEYNQVIETQDIIFGTQGRKSEGTATAIQQESERALKRDTSLIKAMGETRAAMTRAGAAGQASGFTKQQQAQSNQFQAQAIQTIGKQVS